MTLRPLAVALLPAAVLCAGPAAAQNAGSVTTSASMTVLEPAQVRHDADLTVGAVAVPANGSRTARASEGGYTLSGLGGESYTVSTSDTVVLTREGGGEEIRLRIAPSQTVGAFTGTAGQPSTVKVGVGGTVPVPSDAKAGVYKGQYGVTVAYP